MMDLEMRQKMRKGVNYNMRIVIRGEVNTGKTNLFRRLQGLPFMPEYNATSTIASCHIPWSYKITDDIVKVEIWDVVDKAKQKKATPGAGKLKLTNEKQDESSEEEEGVQVDDFVIPLPTSKDPDQIKSGSHIARLDSSNWNVYNQTHGVIIMFDPRREWTWNYVTKEVPKIPTRIRTLILANYRDRGTEVKVTNSEAKAFCRQQGKHVYFLEASMKDCFGLLGVKTFLNLPFLELQREHLEAALFQNQQEEQSVLSEYTFSSNLEYDGWRAKVQLHQDTLPREIITYRRPGSNTTNSNEESPASSDAVSSPDTRERGVSSPAAVPWRKAGLQAATPVPGSTPQPTAAPNGSGTPASGSGSRSDRTPKVAYNQAAPARSDSGKKPTAITSAKKPVEKKEESSGGFFSSLFGGGDSDKKGEPAEGEDAVVDDLRKLAADRKMGILPSEPVIDVTEFAPEAEDDGGFWSDGGEDEKPEKPAAGDASDKESDEGPNPALLGDEDPSSEEEKPAAAKESPPPETAKLAEKTPSKTLDTSGSSEEDSGKDGRNPQMLSDGDEPEQDEPPAKPRQEMFQSESESESDEPPPKEPVVTASSPSKPAPEPTPPAKPVEKAESPKPQPVAARPVVQAKPPPQVIQSDSEEGSEQSDTESSSEDEPVPTGGDDDDWSFASGGDAWNQGGEDEPDFLQIKKYPTPSNPMIRTASDPARNLSKPTGDPQPEGPSGSGRQHQPIGDGPEGQGRGQRGRGRGARGARGGPRGPRGGRGQPRGGKAGDSAK